MKLKKLISEKHDSQYCNSDLDEVYFGVYYMPDGDDKTTWTKRIKKFKSKSDKDDYALITSEIINAIKEENLNFDVVVRNFSHDKTCARVDDKILEFAKSISKSTQAVYAPPLIKKRNATAALHTMGLQERKEVSSGNFYVDEKIASKINDVNSILIVDDITTTGTSLKEIAKVLKERWPNAQISALCLARTIHGNPNANIDI